MTNLFDKAIEDYGLAIKLFPGEAAWARLCDAHRRKYTVGRKNYDILQAIYNCDMAITKYPTGIEAWTYDGDLHLTLGEERGDVKSYDTD
jgi:hypothetical protein